MTYSLGIDLGTTYTSAAIYEDDRATVIDLSGRSTTMASVVFLDEDGSFLVGDAATRRSTIDPARAAQQFKRRFGDTTPVFLGGAPLSADGLTAELLKAVVAQVAQRQGGPADHVTLTHPANWGGYKLELLEQSIRRAGLADATMISEPEAAVLNYSQLERVPTGAVIAVFDLGGGTFDAAVIRKTEDGTEFLGRPEGIERLGGIDFDEAVYAFVVEHLDGAVEALDLDQPPNRAALERLRRDCTEAKEALSSDEAVSIPVLLPSVQTTVRMTRSEFEQLIRPALGQAIDALHRALTSAQVQAADLETVLLAGGSSRMPLVAELVANELGRPVAVDAHPKHVVSMGAAYAAHLAAQSTIDGAASVSNVVAAPMVAATGADSGAAPAAPTEPIRVVEQTPSFPTKPVPVSSPAGEPRSRTPMYVGLGLLGAIVVGGVAVFALGSSGDDASSAGTQPAVVTAVPVVIQPPVQSTEPAITQPVATEPTVPATTAPPYPADVRRVELTGLQTLGRNFEVSYDTVNFEPVIAPGEFHIHFFWDSFAPESVGVSSDPIGDWIVWDVRADGAKIFDAFAVANVPVDSSAICGVVATEDHRVDAPEWVLDTVSCVDLP